MVDISLIILRNVPYYTFQAQAHSWINSCAEVKSLATVGIWGFSYLATRDSRSFLTRIGIVVFHMANVAMRQFILRLVSWLEVSVTRYFDKSKDRQLPIMIFISIIYS